jgi:histidine triad (HIT) family protein
MPAHTDQCTFCDLIKGAAEVSVCHEDADSIAFMDIQPVNAGHVIVVPRAHYNSLLDVPAELGAHLFRVTMRLAGAVRKVTDCEGLNIVVNSGAAAGQDEPHYHVHIIPRRHGDGFEIELPFGGSEMPDRTVLDAVAVQILAALQDPMKVGESSGEASGGNSDEESNDDGSNPRASRSGESHRESSVEARPVARQIRRVERQIMVRVEREGTRSSGDPARRGAWHVREGAHGELIYKPDGV